MTTSPSPPRLEGGGPAGFAIKRGRNIYGALVADKLVDKIADGDPTTAFRLVDDQGLARFSYASPGTFLLDLGWRFPINRIRFYPTPQYSGRNVEEFAVQIVEGSSTGGRWIEDGQLAENIQFALPRRHPQPASGGGTARRVDNRRSRVGVAQPAAGRRFSFSHPHGRVCGADCCRARNVGSRRIRSLRRGLRTSGVLPIQVLDLGAISTLGTLRWIGFKDDDARVEIRTRSGSDLDPRPLLALHWPRRRADLPRRRGPAPNPHRLPKPVLRPRPYHPRSGPLERLVGGLLLRRQLGDSRDLARTAALCATAGRFRHQGRASRGA